jgi:hypothetical protein
MKWIDANIELPKNDGLYLTCCGYNIDIKRYTFHPTIGGVWNNRFVGEWTIGTASISDLITHWMELPKPA